MGAEWAFRHNFRSVRFSFPLASGSGIETCFGASLVEGCGVAERFQERSCGGEIPAVIYPAERRCLCSCRSAHLDHGRSRQNAGGTTIWMASVSMYMIPRGHRAKADPAMSAREVALVKETALEKLLHSGVSLALLLMPPSVSEALSSAEAQPLENRGTYANDVSRRS